MSHLTREVVLQPRPGSWRYYLVSIETEFITVSILHLFLLLLSLATHNNINNKQIKNAIMALYGNLMTVAFWILATLVIIDENRHRETWGPPAVYVWHIYTIMVGLSAWQLEQYCYGYGDGARPITMQQQQRRRRLRLLVPCLCLGCDIGVIGSVLASHWYQFPVPWPGAAILCNLVFTLVLTGPLNTSRAIAWQQQVGIAILATVCYVAALFWVPTHAADLQIQERLNIVAGLIAILTIYLGCLLVKNSQKNSDLILIVGSRWILGLYFCYSIIKELHQFRITPADYTEHLTNLIQSTLLAALGLSALGTFSRSKHLEVQVEQQLDEIHLAGLALQASETAVAVTTTAEKIVWANPALGRMSNHKQKNSKNKQQRNHVVLGHAISKILHLDQDNAVKFRSMCLDATRERKLVQNELTLTIPAAGDNDDDHNKEDTSKIVLHVEVSPFCPRRCPHDKSKTADKTSSSNGDNLTLSNAEQELYDCTKEEMRLLVVLEDITESRAREKAERKTQEEALLTKAMGESMETLTHELRTPLQGIMGITSLLVSDSTIPKDARESLELISASSTLLLTLINNLLDVRKCNAKMMEDFILTPLAPAGPIKDAIGFCKPFAQISNVQINYRELYDCPQTTIPIVLSNNLRMQQICINLVSNAIKYSPTGGVVKVTCQIMTRTQVEMAMDTALAAGERAALPTSTTDRQDQDNSENKCDNSVLVISVRDSGSGIPPSQAKNLFRKFAMLNIDNGEEEKATDSNKRGSTTSSYDQKDEKVGQPMGTGLGLNLCEKFVAQMNGSIWAGNNPDECGAFFSFYLPIAATSNVSPPDQDSHTNTTKNECKAESVPPSVPVLARHLSQELEQIRVLLVDDTLINRKVFGRMLKRVGVQVCDTLPSGEDALEKLVSTEYDVVITDIQMPPGMNGMEFSRAIHASTDFAQRPMVVGLTADTSQRAEEECLASGMADVLHKPLTLEDMRTYFAEKIIPRLGEKT